MKETFSHSAAAGNSCLLGASTDHSTKQGHSIVLAKGIVDLKEKEEFRQAGGNRESGIH